jgi:DNA-directed RNA polymerase specialized sigma24 family protein
LLNTWIEKNILELKKICNRIAKHNDTDDLFQLSIEQLLTNKRINDIPDSQKLFFFARIVKNNFNSKTSRYHKIYRKPNFVELSSKVEIVQEDYQEQILTIDWVLEEVEKIKEVNWYLGKIFLLYLSRGANLTKLSKEIGIPINNLSRDIKEVKDILNKLYKQKLN